MGHQGPFIAQVSATDHLAVAVQVSVDDRGDQARDGAELLLLAAALTGLSPLEATILRLHDESRLSFDEIGDLMGLGLVQVRAAWARGLKELGRTYRDGLGTAVGGDP
jgi:DNA-directed RNA polymerase specialized sigma24 family protein